MPAFHSSVATQGEAFAENRAYLLALIDELRGLEARTEAASAKSAPRFAKRGQLLPRERLGLLLDGGAPFLALSSLAGYLLDVNDPAKSVPGGGCIAGVGSISSTTCMVVVDDSGIEAGALQMKMVYRIGKRYGYDLDRRHITELLGAAGVGLTSQVVEGFARKLLGGLLGKVAVGLGRRAGEQLDSSAMSFASTYALGQMAQRYYAGGRSLSALQLKELFTSLTAQARSLHGRYAGEIQQRASTLNPAQLLNLVRGNPASDLQT